MKKVVKDSSGKLEAAAKPIIEKYFPLLKYLKILYTWRQGDAEWDDEGRIIAAQARKIGTRERDVYGVDVEIRVFRDKWKLRNERGKFRLLWHELKHIDVLQDEDMKVVLDKDERVKYNILTHDVVVTTFEEEIKKFGLSGADAAASEILSAALKKRKEKKNA